MKENKEKNLKVKKDFWHYFNEIIQALIITK